MYVQYGKHYKFEGYGERKKYERNMLENHPGVCHRICYMYVVTKIIYVVEVWLCHHKETQSRG